MIGVIEVDDVGVGGGVLGAHTLFSCFTSLRKLVPIDGWWWCAVEGGCGFYTLGGQGGDDEV
ncbi:MAG TPA: hypothetical protein PLZ32_10245 [Saprospiraceae bacterium]|nr:hypothetical protein [Saprospiraceae bacterium]